MKKIIIIAVMSLVVGPASYIVKDAKATLAPSPDINTQINAQGNRVPSFTTTAPCTPADDACPVIHTIPPVEAIDEGSGNTPPCTPADGVCPVIHTIPPVEAIDEGSGNTPPPTITTPPSGSGNTGGGGGGGGFIPTSVTNTPPTPPTVPESENSGQEVLGEQLFADNSSDSNNVADQQVLGEQVVAPSFPKTGTGTSSTATNVFSLSFLASLVIGVCMLSRKQKVSSTSL